MCVSVYVLVRERRICMCVCECICFSERKKDMYVCVSAVHVATAQNIRT